MVETQEVGESLHLIHGDTGCVELLEALAELILDQLLSKPGIVDGEVNGSVLDLLVHYLSLILHGLVLTLGSPALHLLHRILCKYYAEIQSLVDKCRLDMGESLVDITQFRGLNIAE